MYKTFFKRYFVPVWWHRYERSFLRGDISAGFTIGVMLIPQGMAYALLAGMPPIYGLYASVIPALCYAYFGSSRRLAVGPAAMTCILVASAVGGFAEPETAEYISYVATLSILTGIVYLIFMVLQLGKLAGYLTDPITKGFAAAGAIIIFTNQLKYLFDLNMDRGQNVAVILKQFVSQNDNINWVTFSISITGMIILHFVGKWRKSFPTALVVIFLSILVVWAFRLDQYGVSIMKEVPQGFPSLTAVNTNLDTIIKLFPNAIILAVVGFTMSISVAKIVAERNGIKDVRPRRELFAFGMANIASGIFGTMPVNGSLSRTMVNDQAGARSGISLALSALLVTLTLLFLTPLFYYLPTAILASVIIVAIVKLISPKDAISFYKTSKKDFATYMVTFLSVLLISIEAGIVIGLVFSLVIKLFNKKSEEKPDEKSIAK